MRRWVELSLAGAVRDGHVFHVHVEDSSGHQALLNREPVMMPWLRAACSCGWRDTDAWFTLEENAHASWLNHLTYVKAEGVAP